MSTQWMDRCFEDQQARWFAGEEVLVEDYLARHPELSGDPECLFLLMYHEFLVREQCGHAVQPAEYQKRFPQFSERLARQLELHHALGSSDASCWTEFSVGATEATSSGQRPRPSGRPTPLAANPRFSLLRCIGWGSMGTVHAAYDRQQQQHVAIKTPHSAAAEPAERLQCEFRMLQSLTHPNLPQVFEWFAGSEGDCFTMELIEGVEFVEYVRSRGAEQDRGLRGLSGAFRQLVEGVGYLHQQQLLHCDIKSSNILVGHGGRVVLLDFGLACRRGTGLDTGHRCGTMAYAAPEQLLHGAVSPASDWYSLGVLLYEALAGSLPFQGPAAAVLQAKQQSPAPSPSRQVAGIPQDLDSLCTELLASNPDRRPGGPEVLQRLKRLSPRPDGAKAERVTVIGRGCYGNRVQ